MYIEHACIFRNFYIGNAGNSGAYVDIHTKPELKATEYLPEDMKKSLWTVFFKFLY